MYKYNDLFQGRPVSEGDVGPTHAAGVTEPVDVPGDPEQDQRYVEGDPGQDTEL